MEKNTTPESFLSKMTLATARDARPPGSGAPARTPGPPPPEGGASRPVNRRATLKHIGGYLDRETVEKVALLRARLDLDNSELLQRAIEELFSREMAARKFGDR